MSSHPFFARRPRATIDGRNLALPPNRPAGVPGRGVLSTLAEHVGAIFSIVVTLVLITAIVSLVYAFVREVRRNTLEIDGVSAPRDLYDRGYTGAVIAGAVLGEFSRIENSAPTMHDRRQLETDSSIPDIRVASSGLSMKSLVRYGRRLLGVPEHRISGEIVEDPPALRMVLRVVDGERTQEISVTRSDGNIDALVHDSGRALVQLIDPYVLASYLYDTDLTTDKSFSKTLAAIDYVLAHASAADMPWTYNLLGLVRAQQGDNAAAIAAYRRALALDANLAVVGGNYVQVLVRDGLDGEAHGFVARRTDAAHTLKEFEQAISMNYNVSNYRTAVAMARRALAINPNDRFAFDLLPPACYYMHRPAEALAWAELSVARVPASVGFEVNHAAALALNDRFDESLALAKGIEANAKSNGQADMRKELVWLHGFVELRTGHFDQALGDLRAAIAAGFDDVIAREQAGDAALALGRAAEAADWYRKALAIQPTGLGLAGLARADVQLGHQDDALELFARAVSLDPDNVDVYREWAAALDRAGKSQEAAAARAEIPKAEKRLKVPL